MFFNYTSAMYLSSVLWKVAMFLPQSLFKLIYKHYLNWFAGVFLKLYSDGSFRTLIIWINAHFAFVLFLNCIFINNACNSSVSLKYFTQKNIRIHSKFEGLYNQHIYLQYFDIIFSQYNISNLSDVIVSLSKSLFHRIIAFCEPFNCKHVLKQCFCNWKPCKNLNCTRAIYFF